MLSVYRLFGMPAADSVDKGESVTVDTSGKGGCNCGCKGNQSLAVAGVSATPEFNRRVEAGVRDLVEKAKQVKSSGRKT